MTQDGGPLWRAPGSRPDAPSGRPEQRPAAPEGEPHEAPHPDPGTRQPGSWAAPGGPTPPWEAPTGGGAPYGAGQPPHGGPPGHGGWGPPGGDPPGHGGPEWPAAGPPLPPRPGVVALRPLTLGDIFNGAFSYIRHNPRASLGLAVIVMAVASLLPALGYGSLTNDLLTFEEQLSDQTAVAPEELFPFSTFSTVSMLGGSLISFAAGTILSGLLAGVVGLAVLGRRVTLGEAVRAVRGRIGAVFGLGAITVLLSLLWFVLLMAVLTGGLLLTAVEPVSGVLVLVVGLVLATVLAAWVYIKLALAMPAVVLERVGPFHAIGRSWTLVRRSWWRVFGILLLAQIIAGVVANLLVTPFSLVSAVTPFIGADAPWVPVANAASVYLGSVISGAVTSPFAAGVTTLLYVDMRMRREGLDLRLRGAAASGRQVDVDVYRTTAAPAPPGYPPAAGQWPGPPGDGPAPGGPGGPA
ncbi:glycerophosphoryl diester phosphodiesterase membrane domain-containing protein [Marinactinospora rubrisoli]|uniref:Glycerophosphoryl diester phosphodiesterase membrane domain-containing protein n=1 Tax=Marinactinospora rubrisoli TaxID=2715399 RepID=A0ABW2KC54_9ACTN